MGVSDSGSDLSSRESGASSLGSSGPASDARSTRWNSTHTADASSRGTGPASLSGTTSPGSTQETSRQPTSSAEGSPALTSVSPVSAARELACKALALASGIAWRKLCALRDRAGSWSRTWREAWTSGFPPCEATSTDSGMRRFRSNWKRACSEHPTLAPASSLLPTPTASRYGSSNNGCPGDGRETYRLKGKPSLWSMAKAAGGRLNPSFPLWMMGFPEGWLRPTGGP